MKRIVLILMIVILTGSGHLVANADELKTWQQLRDLVDKALYQEVAAVDKAVLRDTSAKTTELDRYWDPVRSYLINLSFHQRMSFAREWTEDESKKRRDAADFIIRTCMNDVEEDSITDTIPHEVLDVIESQKEAAEFRIALIRWWRGHSCNSCVKDNYITYEAQLTRLETVQRLTNIVANSMDAEEVRLEAMIVVERVLSSLVWEEKMKLKKIHNGGELFKDRSIFALADSNYSDAQKEHIKLIHRDLVRFVDSVWKLSEESSKKKHLWVPFFKHVDSLTKNDNTSAVIDSIKLNRKLK